MYRRGHHQLIAQVLGALDTTLLEAHETFFAGGTAISMRHGEFRLSVDIDFMVADGKKFRELRQLVSASGPKVLFREPDRFGLPASFYSDQYGIRGFVETGGVRIKFEIVHEGRIEFSPNLKRIRIEGVAALGDQDLVAEKIMANSDRFIDSATFHRDILDLAFMHVPGFRSSPGFEKAISAYGSRAMIDLDRSIEKLMDDFNWMDDCLRALQIDTPRAVVVKYLDKLR